jgi:hypothetical protein
MRMHRLAAASLLAAALALAGCGKQDPDQPLAFAPADTPWLLANLEPVPQQSLDGWWKNSEQMLGVYGRVLDSAIADIEAGDPDGTAARVAKALREELRGKFDRAGWEGLGFTGQARSAVYGIGLVPVMRMELGDADAFRAFIARVESRAGAKMASAEIGGQAYWSLGGDSGPAMALMAIQGNHLVITVAPSKPSEALLRLLLGIDRPASNALDAGTLAAFNKERDYLPYGSGYLDTVRLAAAMTGERSFIEQEFLRAAGADVTASIASPACKAEFGALAAAVPRLSFGYAAMDAKSMDLRYAIETAPEHGKGLAGIAAEVPGLTGSGSGLLDVGFGLDLDAFAGFINLRAGKLAAAPFQCEALVPLNDEIAKLNAELANPAVFMAGAAISGFNLSLSRIELPEGATPVVQGKLAIASDNPASLLSMAGGFLPQLATLDLKPGAAPVAMPAGLLPPDAPPAHVAVGDKAIALSLGAGEEASLAAFASAKSGTPAPLMHYGVDARGLKVFLDAVGKATKDQLAAAEAAAAVAQAPADAESEAGSDGAEATPDPATDLDELREAADLFESMQGAYAESIERIDFALFATERGLEAHYVIRLK